MDKLLRDYITEHPEEFIQVKGLMAASDSIKEGIRRRQKEKLRLIEECKRRLYGKQA